MIVRAITQAGDWNFGNSLQGYYTGPAALSQNISTRIAEFVGDCYFNMGAGIDWFFFLSGTKNQLALELAISAVILNSYGVTSINSLSAVLNPVTRNFTVTYNVSTVLTGTIQNSLVVPMAGG